MFKHVRSYYGAYWHGGRPSVNEFATRCCNFIRQIKDVHQEFHVWYAQGESYSKTIEKGAITLDPAELAEIMTATRKARDREFGNSRGEGGHRHSVWLVNAGRDTPGKGMITLEASCGNTRSFNRCTLGAVCTMG